jgi:hypothetical protein
MQTNSEQPKAEQAPSMGPASVVDAATKANRELEREFRTLDPSGSLAVKCHYVTGNKDKWDYQIIADDGLRLNFERLARIAGATIANDPNVDSLETWLDTLRECGHVEVENVVGVSDTEAHVFYRIPNACAESANVLVRLSIASFEQKRHEVVTADTEIAAQPPEAKAPPRNRETAKPVSTQSTLSHQDLLDKLNRHIKSARREKVNRPGYYRTKTAFYGRLKIHRTDYYHWERQDSRVSPGYASRIEKAIVDLAD